MFMTTKKAATKLVNTNAVRFSKVQFFSYNNRIPRVEDLMRVCSMLSSSNSQKISVMDRFIEEEEKKIEILLFEGKEITRQCHEIKEWLARARMIRAELNEKQHNFCPGGDGLMD